MKHAPATLFKPNDKVQVHVDGRWRDAVIVRFAKYGGGYDYQFDPLPAVGVDGFRPSSGGWTYDRATRLREE